MPSGLLDSAEIEIPCPDCGHKTTKSIGWIKAHSDFTCAGCNSNVHLNRGQFLGELRKVDSAVDGLKRTIDRINER